MKFENCKWSVGRTSDGHVAIAALSNVGDVLVHFTAGDDTARVLRDLLTLALDQTAAGKAGKA
jgi:hypothetical protein